MEKPSFDCSLLVWDDSDDIQLERSCDRDILPKREWSIWNIDRYVNQIGPYSDIEIILYFNEP